MKNLAAIGLLLCAMPAGAAMQWAKMDNGKDIAWEEAKAYCAMMGPDWRLPRSLGSMAAIVEPAAG